MIDEDRLRELETDGRRALPMKMELEELVAAYRAKIPGIKVTKGDDGAWVHFETASGKRAAISIEVMAGNRVDLVARTLREWQNEITTRGER